MNWTEMKPIEFDQAKAPTRKAREFVAQAPETLFPRLLPAAKQSPATAADPCGTADMLGLLSTGETTGKD
jgi:hypothetical protein